MTCVCPSSSNTTRRLENRNEYEYDEYSSFEKLISKGNEKRSDDDGTLRGEGYDDERDEVGRGLRRRRRRREPSFSSDESAESAESAASSVSLDASSDDIGVDSTCAGATGVCLPF